jgi:hypothetical protein
MKTSDLTHEHLKWRSVALVVAGLALLALVAASGLGPAPTLAQAPATGTPAPGAAGAAGAQAWIEYPTEGQTLPLEPVRLVVYATDVEGVARIELKINGALLPADAAQEQSFESSRRLLRVEQQWTPDKEGKHILEARGLNTAGGYGEPDFVEFCIGTCQSMVVLTATPSPRPLVAPTITPTPKSPPPAVKPTASPSPSPAPLRITFTADRTRLLFPQCATIQWNVEGGVAAVQLNGQDVPPLAQSQVCPPQTTTFKLVVTGPDGATVAREVTIMVEALAPTLTPTPPGLVPPTPTATPPAVAPPPQPLGEILFSADNDVVAAGLCTMIRWHVSNVKAYWVDGQPGAGDDGSRQICPCQTETHTLQAVKIDGSQQDFLVTIRVRGLCATPTPTPTVVGRLQQPLRELVPVAPVATPTFPIIK